MQDCVKRDMDWSARLFSDAVWPLISGCLGGGELLKMEGRPDLELARDLDMKAGIDGWHIHVNGMRGIASRIQTMETARRKEPYNTFTVRLRRDSGAKTEYEKRLFAIENKIGGWIYPALTVQAYAATKRGPIISCGVARTADIIAFIQQGHHTIRRTTNAQFAVCEWGQMRDHGFDVRIFTLEDTV